MPAFARALDASVVGCMGAGVVLGGTGNGASRGATNVVGGGVAGLAEVDAACGMGASPPLGAWGLSTSGTDGVGERQWAHCVAQHFHCR